MKKVNIISTVVQKGQPGQRIPTGNTIIVQGGGGSADMEEVEKSFLSKIKDDSSKGIIDFLVGFKIAGLMVRTILKTDSDADIADDNIMSSARVMEEINGGLKNLDQRYLSKLKDDRTPFKLSVGDTFTSEVYARLKGITEADDVSVNEAIHSKEFVSGFTAGKGWAIRMKDYLNSAGVNEKRSVAEFDDLIVRGTLKVFEFVVSQMLGENDNRTFTGMMEVDHYDKESGMVYFDTKDGQLYNPFRKDDIIIVQQYGGMPSEDNGYYITKQYELVIESVGVDWVTFRNFASPMDGETEELIVKGDTFVRIDNLTDDRRKGIMQIMTVGEDTPYMDVIYGKKTDPDNALKVRMGNLEGIYNHLFGWLKDFGAYIANLYAVGEFRIAHTGEDVSDKIEMTKGAFRTNFNQTYFDITSVDNHLKNGSFSGDIGGWVLGETDTDFLVVNGIALYANRNLMTANSKFAGRAVYNDKDMMRVRNSHIMQYNSDVKPFGYHKEYTPMDGSETEPSFQYKEVKDKAYLSMRFHCNGSGTLEVGFDTTDTTDGAFPFTVMEVQKRVESYQLEASGIWSGEGNFVIRCSGDVYIEYVSLTDNPVDNLKITTRTWIEQDAGRIALLGEKINNAQGTMTNLGIELNAVEERLNLYVEKTDTHDSQISQLQIDTNGIRTTVASVQGTLSNTTATANSALSKAQEALWSAQDAAYDASVAKSNAATALNQSSNAIDILAVNFDDYGNVLSTSGIKTYVDGAISGIKLTADNVDINNGVVEIDKTSAKIGCFLVAKNRLYNTYDDYTFSIYEKGIKIEHSSSYTPLFILSSHDTYGSLMQLYNINNDRWIYLNPGNFTIGAHSGASFAIDLDTKLMNLNGGLAVKNFRINVGTYASDGFWVTSNTTFGINGIPASDYIGRVLFVYFKNECNVTGLSAGSVKCKYGTIFISDGSSWYHFKSYY